MLVQWIQYTMFSAVLLFGLCLPASYANDTPEGSVILTMDKTLKDSASQAMAFDLAMLERLPQYEVTTHNPWTQGRHTYRGVSAVDLLAVANSQANLLKVTALNRYMTEIPIRDFIESQAILATHIDGHPMSVRNLGPIMVIYPFDERPELKSETFYGRSIWQISHITPMIVKE
ncbi:molybdopterin-dependent oxidoreductase [Marinomonas algarum]|uniref:Molybdopterin-dependent oxidoreductase n=1 Tax=Marinomonas algarum TaxID=2883105 RepID=A0A9X1IPF8_9GAMM|nr:molybdopterin-dependent oxidoreductase [Marinomonas algarum]MCB5161716.1 molybdopterin-dependent oxidoreductase [Marinomonas algarum]